MKARLACGLGILLLTGVASGGGAKKDEDKLQGKWLAELDGKKMELKLTKDKFAMTMADGDEKKVFKGTAKIDSASKPKRIDFTIEEGDRYVGDTARGIYELDGDTLKWCSNHPGKEDRPKEFPAMPGEGGAGLYLVFKRSK
jgi:uncharacterized protein (TIGR03067 family)